MRLLALLFTLLALSLLAACSMTTFAYNNAVPLLSWYIDDYVDLRDEQRDFARKCLERLHVWHRASELPEYRRVIDAALRESQGPVSGEDVRRYYLLGRTFMTRAGEHALADAADFLLQLDSRQIGMLEARLAKENDKLERERIKLPLEVRQEKRLQRYVESFESWLGGLTAEQKEYVAEALSRMSLTDEVRLEERRRLQQEFIQTLQSVPGRKDLIDRLHVILIDPEPLRAPAYRAQVERWQHDVPHMVAWVVNHATPQQRAYLGRKLRSYSEDIVSLMQTVS
jgi:hypothetical protein